MFKVARSHQFQTSAQRLFGSKAVHSRLPKEKNYYHVLGIDNTATPEQIKDAYHKMVKQHHPDLAGGQAPDANKFREIMEAYSVLSVRESRANYDIQMRKNPLQFQEISETEFNRLHRPDLRDESGNIPAAKPAIGSYAEERAAELAEERKKYNVNYLGYYKGGLP